MTDPTDSTQESARLRRNKLYGRLIIIILGLLALAQVAPILQRALQGRPL